MADEEMEGIGGISVSIGASHAQLVSDLTRADQLLEAWAKQKFVVNIGASVSTPTGGAAPRPRAEPITFGAQARGGAQAREWENLQSRIDKATGAVSSHKEMLVDVQQVASKPAVLTVETGASQNDINQLNASLRETVALLKEAAALPPPKAAGGGTRSRVRSSAGGLEEQTAQAQADAQARGTDYIGAQPLTQQRRAEQEAERRAAANRPQVVRAAVPLAAAAAAPMVDAIEQERRRLVADLDNRGGRGAGGIGGRGASEEDILRREQQRVATAESVSAARGRTSRTFAASTGGQFLFGGPAREQAEAVARQTAAEQNLTRVRRLRDDPATIRNANAFRKATEEVTVAENDLARASQRVRDLGGGGTALRTLAAVTVAGAAFGVGMKVVDVVLDQVSKGFNEFFEIQTGFGATSTRVTSALGQQTLALHGNVDAALLAAEAQAGLSDASAQALNTQLRLTTQIKAGALAQQQASELFRAGFGKDNAPSGLFGSYGGVLGTGLFGQKGFSQQVQTDIAAFTQGRGGADLLGNFSRGLDYVGSPGVRGSVNSLAMQQGDTLLPAITAATLDFPKIVTRTLSGDLQGLIKDLGTTGSAGGFQQTALSDEGQAYLNNLNDAARRGAQALGDTATASYRVARSQTEVDQATRAAAAAGDSFGVALAQQSGIVLAFGDAVAGATGDVDEYRRGTRQAAVGAGIADPAMIGKANLAAEQQRQKESAASLDAIRARQAFEMPSIIAAALRQQQFASQTQLPAQFALGALAAPNLAVGTGIAPEDQERVATALGEAKDLQTQLNAQYDRGKQIIADTYRPSIVTNFGEAAATAFDTALSAVETTGAAIAKIQTGISNKQAAYQVAQYNFQLLIAKRTLGDISGLTGHNYGVEATRLGLLERENLQLSRQGQMLQFNLSQRQINFQTAVAGFSTPGVTPEERQANIKQAQIEASFAQKQLDIQKEMFGNQVQIVDIGNLRQGADLMRQIGLLQQGRAITIDTAAAEQQLLRLNQMQQQNVAQVGTYIEAVNGLVTTAFGYIGQLEAAAGRAMAGVATSILSQFGIFLSGVNQYLGALGASREMTRAGGRYGDKPVPLNASGGVYGVASPTRIGGAGIAGEAGDETLIILSRPRSATSGAGGGSTVVVQFNGDIHTSNAGDLDKITRAVMKAMGREASTLGLRSVG